MAWSLVQLANGRTGKQKKTEATLTYLTILDSDLKYSLSMNSRVFGKDVRLSIVMMDSPTKLRLPVSPKARTLSQNQLRTATVASYSLSNLSKAQHIIVQTNIAVNTGKGPQLFSV
ncbi:hypothetical protein PHMEG_00020331 [Phytophthora megakarya]|uniref:Uncharacterized protein n=1 Tax=Phytophthora megakarya TaxID=4795 RepID=A0A225VP72_9STRA|nr:hypothetical protein PHMEG_00020331 [Phytophthora megakarya]